MITLSAQTLKIIRDTLYYHTDPAYEGGEIYSDIKRMTTKDGDQYLKCKPADKQSRHQGGMFDAGWTKEQWEAKYGKPLTAVTHKALAKVLPKDSFTIEIIESGHVIIHLKKSI